MKSIVEKLNEAFINESDFDDIILRNLDELSDNDVIEDMRDYVADNVDPARVLKIWNTLKSKLGRKTKLWLVPLTHDIDNYYKNCQKWAGEISKKYGFKDREDVDILTGIAWMVNGL